MRLAAAWWAAALGRLAGARRSGHASAGPACPWTHPISQPLPPTFRPRLQTEASVDLPESGELDMFEVKPAGSFSNQGYYNQGGFSGSYTSGYSS
jgi:hypothetical protein